MKRVLITGAAGFVGAALAGQLAARGYNVVGVDNFNKYYDPRLKDARAQRLTDRFAVRVHALNIQDVVKMRELIDTNRPSVVVHCAAQAGVRYSIENPDAYLSSNVLGTQSLVEALAGHEVEHFIFASTSSVYGGSNARPYLESATTDSPMSLYAATKRAGESLLHAASHLTGLPVTCLRFFTVYGPWGRPDMALFKFASSALAGQPIDVYGYGQMKRDFTFIDDLVLAIEMLVSRIPAVGQPVSTLDSLSPVAPFRVVNVGPGRPTSLLDFIACLEDALGIPLRTNMLPMQPGDVRATHADNKLLMELIGDVPWTSLQDGVKLFVDWYLSDHRKGG
ncbi:NAD-dependent epimerase [Nocardioides ginkgobilobae]